MQITDAILIYRHLFVGDAPLFKLGQGCVNPPEKSLELSCNGEIACVEPTRAPAGPFQIFISTDPDSTEPPPRGIGLFGAPGEVFSVPYYVFLRDQAADQIWASGWSVGIRADSSSIEATVSSATTSGTVAEGYAAGGLFDAGFRHTAPAAGNSFASGVTLSFTQPIALPEAKATLILQGTLSVTAPQRGQEGIVFLGVADGLEDPSEPVALEVGTYCQGPFTPDTVPLKVFVASPEELGVFLRGDVNQDNRYDISDPIAALSWLFLGTSAPACPDASDTNDDGRIDISDAVASLNCQFLGGTCPPQPFPSCGRDPTTDDMICTELRFDCF